MDSAVDVVRKVFPNPDPDYVEAFDVGTPQLQAAGVTTPRRLAHLLAQCWAETGQLRVKRESLRYSTEARLAKVFDNMSKTVPLFPGEVTMLLKQEHDLGERFYGIAFKSDLYSQNHLNGGSNPGNKHKADKLGNFRVGDGFLFRGNGLLQTTGGGAHKKAGNDVGVDFFGHPELVTSPEHALKAMLFEWTNSKCNDLADQDDLLSISRAVNLGDSHSHGTPNGMADRIAGLKRAKVVLGID